MRLDTRLDTKIKVDVPATQGRKAYSYYREGTTEEAKKSRRSKVGASVVTGALAVGGAALLAKRLSDNKSSPTALLPKSEDKELSLASKNKLSDSQKTGLKVAAGVTGSVATYIGARKIQDFARESDIVRKGDNLRDGIMTEDQVSSYLKKGLSKKDEANIREYMDYWKESARINGIARYANSPSIMAEYEQTLSKANYKRQDYLTIGEAEWMEPYNKLVDAHKKLYGEGATSRVEWRSEALEAFGRDKSNLKTLEKTEKIVKAAKKNKNARLLEDLIGVQRDFFLDVSEMQRFLVLQTLERTEKKLQSSRPTSDSMRLDTTCDRGKPCQGEDGKTYCIPQGATCSKGKVGRIVKGVAGAVGRGAIAGLTAVAIAKLANKDQDELKGKINTGKAIFNAGRATGKIESKVANSANAIGRIIKKRR